MGLVAACSEFFTFLGSFFELLPNACKFLITGIFGSVVILSILKMTH
jgi:hypothetical protein